MTGNPPKNATAEDVVDAVDYGSQQTALLREQMKQIDKHRKADAWSADETKRSGAISQQIGIEGNISKQHLKGIQTPFNLAGGAFQLAGSMVQDQKVQQTMQVPVQAAKIVSGAIGMLGNLYDTHLLKEQWSAQQAIVDEIDLNRAETEAKNDAHNPPPPALLKNTGTMG